MGYEKISIRGNGTHEKRNALIFKVENFKDALGKDTERFVRMSFHHAWGARGRRFESSRPDQKNQGMRPIFGLAFFFSGPVCRTFTLQFLPLSFIFAR